MALALPATAQAATTITYTGTIYDRQATGDWGQYFGIVTPNSTSYTLVYTIGDAASGVVSNPDPYTTRISGPGAVTAVMTINGVSRSIGGTKTSHALAYDAKPNNVNSSDGIGQMSQDKTDTAEIYYDIAAETAMSSYLNSFLSTADYTTPFTYQLVNGDSFLSGFHINDKNWQTGVGSSIYLLLGGTSITVANTPAISAAVPEPATWMMMIGGMAIAGGSLRRRRTKVSFA